MVWPNHRILSIVLITVLCACGQKPAYHSEGLLTKPTLFSNEITTRNGISFSPEGDELYVSMQLADTFNNGRLAAGIFKYEFKDDVWVGPERVSISGLQDAYHAVQSSDGNRLFFNSRSHPDSGRTYLFHDIWFMEKSGAGWSNPQHIGAVNTEYYESYPTVAANGNLYFNSDRPGGKGGMDFYMSEFKNGTYSEAVRLDVINSEHEENDLVVDPYERFIILNRYVHSDRSIDLWISTKENDQWTVPRKLDAVNESDVWELTPTLSPDGKYFFYEKNSQIWQVDLKAILN